MRYAFVLDQGRCIGCHACSIACKAEHDVPLGSYRTWVKYVEKGTFPDTRRFFTVLRCNHCDDAPCVTICPTTALFRRDDGIVDFDRDACIGCKACMQACPYDALYIHPERNVAEKCNFCSHRIEIDLEPPCATVCPTEAILVGDLDDPSSRVARIVATEEVDVRKPEKGTVPKVFYREGEPRALVPGASSDAGGSLWADRPDEVRRGGPALSGEAGQRANSEAGDAAEARDRRVGDFVPEEISGPPETWIGDAPPPAADQMARREGASFDAFGGAWAGAGARTTYDVAHPRPWGWAVSGYLWTKSIAAGAFLVDALGPWLGLGSGAGLALPLVGLAFLALTTALLVADLKRPERFWTILTRPNWSSWLAKGAFVLVAFGAIGTAWLAAGWLGADGARAGLRWPLVALAAAAAGYSGWLFAQARGRDYWQSPVVPVHLVVQAVAAGAAAALVVRVAAGVPVGSLPGLLLVSLGFHVALVVFGEATVAHATDDAERASRELVAGSLSAWFWGSLASAAAAGMLVAAGGAGLVAGAVLALVAVWAWEHAWLLAGQVVPLS